MKKVLFRKRYIDNNRVWQYGDFENPGKFHQWAVGYEEFETGPGNYTYALVELEDGTMEEVWPTNIKFIY